MELLVLWLVFAIATAAVASNKGRSGVGWFFIGLVLGIIALILVAILPSPRAEAERHAELVAAARGREPENPGRMPCPRCGESIPRAASACRYCGHELRPAGAP